jgi:hypothetical protein
VRISFESFSGVYIAAAGIKSDKDTPLWRCFTRERSIGDGRLTRIDVYRMIKRRCRQAELGAAANCHTFRAAGITAYLLNGGSLENAQAIAAHESPRTTKLYDRTSDEITLDEIERIGICPLAAGAAGPVPNRRLVMLLKTNVFWARHSVLLKSDARNFHRAVPGSIFPSESPLTLPHLGHT